MNLNQIKKKYRTDIDGLRAIAVSVVILFHLGIGYFPSGFIGVDIFFVISGYLITGVILSSLKEGTFSYSDFFVRRLWRIQPALILVGIVTLLASSVLFVSPDYLDYLKSAKYNTLLIANQYFSRQSVAYATPESDIFPLLHTWSLAVEWQWYIFLPLFIAITIFLKKRVPATKNVNISDNFILVLWSVITVVSAALGKVRISRSFLPKLTR
ncbi:acyltransferase [Enterobacter sp. SECR18-0236]|uniref:acyltransferase family protein n=1 Tax=Enterobacter sp. SECR18-0236 TaxID=2749083 RepID=UPI0015B6455B|nr:acyltransferase [Enterobacter sp. SECR18-0236]MBH0128423.1 acyltransferase [Enterobacter sp. SECR18-0236]